MHEAGGLAWPGFLRVGDALTAVLMILIDTMRADRIGAILDGESLTPNLDLLASGSLHFTRSISGSNRTRASMPTVFASLPVEVTGSPVSSETKMLPEILHDAGYATFDSHEPPILMYLQTMDVHGPYLPP